MNKNIVAMMQGKSLQSIVFLGKEISVKTDNPYFIYGEYNGKIIECLNDCLNDPLVIITDNVIKFIAPKEHMSISNKYNVIDELFTQLKQNINYININQF